MNRIYKQLIEKIKNESAAVRKVFTKLKQRKPADLDQSFHRAHEKVFKKINCLECANCCKTTSPIFRDVDIKRISKQLRLKEKVFIESHLLLDAEGDYVLKSSPCVFLAEDNTCSIYEFRPLACREYPHTDRKNMHQILDLTEKNTLICPAVAEISLEILEKYK